MKKFKSRVLLVVIASLISSFSWAQNIKVTGIVRDENNETLPSVSIYIKGTTVGAISDMNGKYSISVPDKSSSIVFSFIGYKLKEIAVGNQTSINVQLEPDAIGIDEVVAVGYGTQKKSDITGAVASFDVNSIKERPQTNIVQSLQGSVAGLNVTTSSSSAEDGASMFIRGNNSITASNNPLIILDGIAYTGSLSSINPNDIASIEVLKDASSTAIYGSRGANGVILIATKQGKSGKMKVSYDGFYSWDEIAHMSDMQDAGEYWAYKWDRGVTNVLNYPLASQTVAQRIGLTFPGDEQDNTDIRSFMMGYPGQTWESFTSNILSKYPEYVTDYETLKVISNEFAYPEGGRNTDWVDLATRLGHKQKHNVSLSGGTDVAKYYVSASYNNVEGISKGDNYQNMIYRINLNLKLFEGIYYGTNTQLGFYDRSGVKANWGGSTGAFLLNPMLEPYNEDGSINIYPRAENQSRSNPLEPLLYDNSDQEKRITTNHYVDIDVPWIEGLHFKLNIGYTWSNRSNRTYKGKNTATGIINNGYLNLYDSKGYNWTIENILSYTKSFNKHKLFITALYSSQESLGESNSLNGKGFDNDVRTWYQAGSAEILTASAGYSNKNYISQMFRANYGYDERYLLTATARRDGYSAFGTSTKFGIFPSIALGWNISNEAFAEGWGNIDVLKLRTSYGKNGNEAIRPYATLPTMSSKNYIDPDGNIMYGYYPNKLENPGLGWETTKSLNIGLDFTLLKGRIRGALDAYNSNTSDLLLNETISSINGTSSITRNIGETKNRGVELQFLTVNISKRNFSWKTDFNFSTYNTEIVNVGLVDENGNYTDDIASQWFIGHPVNVNFDYVLDRVLQKEDFILDENGDYVLNAFGSFQLIESVKNEIVVFGSPFPGKPIVKDVNEDGIIGGSEDKEIIGDRMPNYVAGMTNTFKFRNWTFTFFLNGVWGITKKNSTINMLSWGDARTVSGIDYWTVDNPSTELPGINLGSLTAQNLVPYGDANFVRVQDITLSYTLPPGVLSRISFSDFTVFMNIKNLHTFTNWEGIDPEYSYEDNTPRARSYILGLRFSF